MCAWIEDTTISMQTRMWDGGRGGALTWLLHIRSCIKNMQCLIQCQAYKSWKDVFPITFQKWMCSSLTRIPGHWKWSWTRTSNILSWPTVFHDPLTGFLACCLPCQRVASWRTGLLAGCLACGAIKKLNFSPWDVVLNSKATGASGVTVQSNRIRKPIGF